MTLTDISLYRVKREHDFEKWIEQELLNADGAKSEESSSYWKFITLSSVYEQLYGHKPDLKSFSKDWSQDSPTDVLIGERSESL